MADEDIELTADTSRAVKALQQLREQGVAAIEALGLSAKSTEGAFGKLETRIGGIAAKMLANSRAVEKSAQMETKAYERIWTAAEKAEQARRATASIGVGVNKSGQAYNVDSGQFAGKAALDSYQNQLAMIGRLEVANGSYNRSIAQTASQLSIQQGLTTRLGEATDFLARQRERSARQQQLETVFAKSFYTTADQNAGVMKRLGTVMGQFPPATWLQGIRSIGSQLGEMSNATRYALYDVSASFGIAGAALTAFGITSINAAIQHERAFANVQRTTMTTKAGYEALRRQIELMSMEIPTSFEDLTEIASAAGQLGIGASGVAAFTRTVAMLSATTNLSADAAGIALARFRAFFSEAEDSSLAVTEQTFSNLASSILKVGVNSIASETGIVNVAVQIASMADYAGMTAHQVIGLAGALSSIGVAPELSRGTITRTFTLIGNAVSNGGVQLEKFAALSGTSAAEFKRAWGTSDFADVFTDLVGGIRELGQSGQDANLALQDLGFASIRDRPLLLRLAEAADDTGAAGQLLAQSFRDAEDGWRSNIELAVQYTKISSTTSARLQVLGQAFEQLAASMGEQSGGVIGEAAKVLTGFIREVEAFANSDAGKIWGTILTGASLAAGGLLLMVAAGARAVASLQGIGFAWKMLSNTSVSAMGRMSAAFRVMNLSLGIIGIVGAIATAVGSFVALDSSARKAKRAIQDYEGLVAAMKTDYEGGARAVQMYASENTKAAEEQANSKQMAEGMTEALYGVSGGGQSAIDSLLGVQDAADKAGYAYGNATRDFIKGQLAQSEELQKLFSNEATFSWSYGSVSGGDTLRDLGLDPSRLDFEGMARKALQGQDVRKVVDGELEKQLGDLDLLGWAMTGGDLAQIDNARETLISLFSGTRDEIQSVIDRNNALETSSQEAFKEYADGAKTASEMMSELDEVTQKAVEGVAGGFMKFVDVKGLIGLTQQMLDTSEEGAAAYEKAWVDAYGGASFSLEQYLTNYRRAAEEQKSFITNLGVLQGAGVSTDILNDLAAMGPEANRLVQAMVNDINETGGAGLTEFEDLWGRTGFDSMVAFAVQAELGQEIIRNVMSTGGATALRAFNDELSSGKGVNEALAALQRDVDGNPITPATKPVNFSDLTPQQKALWAAQNALYTTASIIIPNIDGSGNRIGNKVIDPGYADGGYVSGAGTGTSDSIPARLSHGEFVFTAAATRAIGVNNLYSIMRAAQGGRAAPRGRGSYAGGGAVSGGLSDMVVHLSPEDRALLMRLEPVVMIGDRDISRSQANVNRVTKRQGV